MLKRSFPERKNKIHSVETQVRKVPMLLVKNGAGKSGEEERRNKRSLKDNNLLGAQRVFVCLDKELKLTKKKFSYHTKP